MIVSMTGFGRGKKKMKRERYGGNEISQSPFCEISIRMPRQWVMFEE